MKKVKLWVVLNHLDEITSGDFMEQDYDCACRAFMVRGGALFKTKKDAESWATHSNQRAVRCEVSFKTKP